MNKKIRIYLFFLVALIILGCGGSKPSRYYLLSEMKEQNPGGGGEGKELKIGIGPVIFPEYLKRPQIGYFVGENQLGYAEYDRWAEPLDVNFMRVLSENLSVLLEIDAVYTYPFFATSKLDLQLVLDVREFQMNMSGKVRLLVQWQVVTTADQQTIFTRKSEFIEQAIPDNYASIVSGMSKAVENLSLEISDGIKKLE